MFSQVLDLVTGEELGVGETGELCFQGPQVSSLCSTYELVQLGWVSNTQYSSFNQVMPGYFKNSEATASTLVDGWCHTGDIGYYDEASIQYSPGEILLVLKSQMTIPSYIFELFV